MITTKEEYDSYREKYIHTSDEELKNHYITEMAKWELANEQEEILYEFCPLHSTKNDHNIYVFTSFRNGIVPNNMPLPFKVFQFIEDLKMLEGPYSISTDRTKVIHKDGITPVNNTLFIIGKVSKTMDALVTHEILKEGNSVLKTLTLTADKIKPTQTYDTEGNIILTCPEGEDFPIISLFIGNTWI